MGGEEENKSALGPEAVVLSTWSCKRLSVPFRSIHSISGIQIINTISQYKFAGPNDVNQAQIGFNGGKHG